MDKWEMLRKKFPWPEQCPDVPKQSHGWFFGDDAESLNRAISFVRKQGRQVELYLELGSWLGSSVRHVLKEAPSARAICCDLWPSEVSQEFSWKPVMYETFLANNWEYRDLIIPVRTDVRVGLEQVVRAGLRPDVIYIDADHSYEAVLGDTLLAAWEFPKAVLVLDDNIPVFPGVQQFVRELPTLNEGTLNDLYTWEEVDGSVVMYPTGKTHLAAAYAGHR